MESIKPISNYLVVEIQKELNTETQSGILVRNDWDRNKHLRTHGKVVALPDRLFFKKENVRSLAVDTDMELQIGDHIWFKMLAAEQNVESGTDASSYAYIKYDSVILAQRGDKIFGVSGHLLYISVKEQDNPGLIKKPRLDNIENEFEVICTGNRVRAYRDRRSNGTWEGDDTEPINVGDKIFIMDKIARVPLQFAPHKNVFPEHSEVYYSRRNIIDAKIT